MLFLPDGGVFPLSLNGLARVRADWHAGCNEGGNQTKKMKTNRSLLIIAAAAASGALLAKLAAAGFLADVSGESLMAVAASAGLLLFAWLDYRRERKTVSVPATVLRPALPAVRCLSSAQAYGIRRRSAIVERIAC
jgi:hypothetical protein